MKTHLKINAPHINKYPIVLIMLQFILIISNASAQLNGKFRENFIESYKKSCFTTQRSATANKNTSDRILSQYCNCNALYMSNILNNALATSIENGEQQINPNLIQLSGNYCSKNYMNH